MRKRGTLVCFFLVFFVVISVGATFFQNTIPDCRKKDGERNRDLIVSQNTTPDSRNKDVGLNQMETQRLSRKELAFLRETVFKKGLCISAGATGPFAGHRTVSVPDEVKELHKMKRAGTLSFLLDVVRGGHPADAQTAASIAVALETTPVEAIPIADTSLEAFDEILGNTDETLRESLVQELSKALNTAEKKIKSVEK